MTFADQLNEVDEHIAQVSLLGLDALSNPDISLVSTHQADGFIKTRVVWQKDYQFVRTASAPKNISCPLFRLGRNQRATLKHVSFRGHIETSQSPPFYGFGYALASSPLLADDLASPGSTILVTNGLPSQPFIFYDDIATGVVEFSSMHLTVVLAPFGPFGTGKINKGTKLEVLWLPLN